MADIRQTPLLDTFNRSTESPILPPWQYLAMDTASTTMDLNGSGYIESSMFDPNYQGSAILVSASTELTQYGTYDLEVWARASANAELHDSYQLGMFALDGRGYKMHSANSVGSPDGMSLMRYDDPYTRYEVGSNPDVGVISSPYIILMRATTSAVELWVNEDGSGNSWTLYISAADTTHREFLYPFLGIRGGTPGWEEMGGGKPRGRTQIFRYVRN